MSVSREAKESPYIMGWNEVFPLSVDFTAWGGSPSSPSNVITDLTTGTVTSTTNLTGSPSVSSNSIITSVITGLSRGHQYRLDVQCTIGGKTEEAYIIINCE